MRPRNDASVFLIVSLDTGDGCIVASSYLRNKQGYPFGRR